MSVILPAFNEEARISRGIVAVTEYLAAQDYRSEVIVVDDGSLDTTPQLLLVAQERHPGLRVESLPENRGKGAAVRAGVRAARGRYVLFTDVDQSTPISEWERLHADLARGYDVVIASREVSGSDRAVPQPWYRHAMGYAFMVLRDLLVLPGFIDSQCGFKAFTRDAAHTIFSRARLDGFCFDVEVLAIAAQHGLRIVEAPVTWRDDPASRVSPLLDSLRMLRDLFVIRRNRARGLYD